MIPDKNISTDVLHVAAESKCNYSEENISVYSQSSKKVLLQALELSPRSGTTSNIDKQINMEDERKDVANFASPVTVCCEYNVQSLSQKTAQIINDLQPECLPLVPEKDTIDTKEMFQMHVDENCVVDCGQAFHNNTLYHSPVDQDCEKTLNVSLTDDDLLILNTNYNLCDHTSVDEAVVNIETCRTETLSGNNKTSKKIEVVFQELHDQRLHEHRPSDQQRTIPESTCILNDPMIERVEHISQDDYMQHSTLKKSEIYEVFEKVNLPLIIEDQMNSSQDLFIKENDVSLNSCCPVMLSEQLTFKNERKDITLYYDNALEHSSHAIILPRSKFSAQLCEVLKSDIENTNESDSAIVSLPELGISIEKNPYLNSSKRLSSLDAGTKYEVVYDTFIEKAHTNTERILSDNCPVVFEDGNMPLAVKEQINDSPELFTKANEVLAKSNSTIMQNDPLALEETSKDTFLHYGSALGHVSQAVIQSSSECISQVSDVPKLDIKNTCESDLNDVLVMHEKITPNEEIPCLNTVDILLNLDAVIKHELICDIGTEILHARTERSPVNIVSCGDMNIKVNNLREGTIVESSCIEMRYTSDKQETYVEMFKVSEEITNVNGRNFISTEYQHKICDQDNSDSYSFEELEQHNSNEPVKETPDSDHDISHDPCCPAQVKWREVRNPNLCNQLLKEHKDDFEEQNKSLKRKYTNSEESGICETHSKILNTGNVLDINISCFELVKSLEEENMIWHCGNQNNCAEISKTDQEDIIVTQEKVAEMICFEKQPCCNEISELNNHVDAENNISEDLVTDIQSKDINYSGIDVVNEASSQKETINSCLSNDNTTKRESVNQEHLNLINEELVIRSRSIDEESDFDNELQMESYCPNSTTENFFQISQGFNCNDLKSVEFSEISETIPLLEEKDIELCISRSLYEISEDGISKEKLVRKDSSNLQQMSMNEAQSMEKANDISISKLKVLDQDEQMDTELLDSIIDRTVDQMVPDEDFHTDDQHAGQTLYSEDHKKKLYATGVGVCVEPNKVLCTSINKAAAIVEAVRCAPEHEHCFNWKYAPSCDTDSDALDVDSESQIVKIVPLKTCGKPLRLGLSKKQPVSHLHKTGMSKHF